MLYLWLWRGLTSSRLLHMWLQKVKNNVHKWKPLNWQKHIGHKSQPSAVSCFRWVPWQKINFSLIFTRCHSAHPHVQHRYIHKSVILPLSLISPPGCGKLTGVSNPITVRASGSRFGSWMTDTMIPSSDNRVSPSVFLFTPELDPFDPRYVNSTPQRVQ